MQRRSSKDSDGNGSESASAQKVHVLFFAPSLGGGGAELQLLRLANHLSRDTFQVSIALGRGGGAYEDALARDVQVYILRRGRLVSSAGRMMRSVAPLRRLIRTAQPDIVFSVMGHANIAALLAMHSMSQCPAVVLGEQTPPSYNYGGSGKLSNRLIFGAIPRLYPLADHVVALSHGVAEELQELAPKLSGRCTVIPNAGTDERVRSGAQGSIPDIRPLQDEPLLVACGRLVRLKGFSYLIDAVRLICQNKPVRLWIIGEGEDRPRLQRQIDALHLTDRVRLLGFQQNPYQYMAAADLFVLSSLYEGFGNVIVEAMACGVAVVSTDCPYGPGEIIQNGVNGVLVPPASTEALAQAILRLLSDEELRRKIANNGKRRAQDFDVERVAAAYGDLFLRVVNSGRAAA